MGKGSTGRRVDIMTGQPKVSIVCVTYNQEEYLREAIDNFLMQETNFNYEIIISDDYSTDSTREIIKQYAKQYPKLIKVNLQTKNMGVARNFKDALLMASGEYIALCEGDDFWTDSKKLQIQVDFMVKYPHYALCFHPVRVFFQNNLGKESLYPDDKAKSFTLRNLLLQNYIQTNSVMYRRVDYTDLLEDVLPIDWYLHLFHAQYGKVGFINRVMAAYRKHEKSIWWESTDNIGEIWRKHGVEHLGMYIGIFNLFSDRPKLSAITAIHIKNMINVLHETDMKYNTKLLFKGLEKYPEAAIIYVNQVYEQIKEMDYSAVIKDKNLVAQQDEIMRLNTILEEQRNTINEQSAIITKLNQTFSRRATRFIKHKLKR